MKWLTDENNYDATRMKDNNKNNNNKAAATFWYGLDSRRSFAADTYVIAEGVEDILEGFRHQVMIKFVNFSRSQY